jgi:hypothetical protein
MRPGHAGQAFESFKMNVIALGIDAARAIQENSNGPWCTT